MQIFEEANNYGIEPNTPVYSLWTNNDSAKVLCGLVFTHFPGFANLCAPPLFKLPPDARVADSDWIYRVEKCEPGAHSLTLKSGINTAIVLPYRSDAVVRPYHEQADVTQRQNSYVYVLKWGLTPELAVHIASPVRSDEPFLTQKQLMDLVKLRIQ